MTAKHEDPALHEPVDDSDADAFAVLSLLVILAAGIVFYINN